LFGTVQDITDRKRAEEALKQSQFYLSEGQRLAHMGSWASNNLGIRWSDDLGIYWSEEVYRIYGLDPQNGARTLSSIWPQSTLMTELPWLKPSGRCMSSAVAVT
jgi:PAS domain-containing protein